MTASVPDDVTAYLHAQGDASTVTETVRRVARRARQRAAAAADGEYLRQRTADQAEADAALIEISNDISLHNAQW